MAAMSDARVTDERVKCLRIFADANGETHMEDVDIALQPKKLFEDDPPLRLSDNLPASWCNICHVPTGMCEVDWHNPPRRLLVLWANFGSLADITCPTVTPAGAPALARVARTHRRRPGR
jgi:hypothetical protein